MCKLSFTPGPWILVHREYGGFDVLSENHYVCPNLKCSEANAQLIACAPELLLACKGALSALLIGPHLDQQQAIDYLIEVIEKATGGDK